MLNGMHQAWSDMFRVDFGVRQGSVLSPYLFAIYMDNLAKLCQYNRGMFIILYNNNHLYSPHYGSSDSTKKQQKEKAEKIQ